jgi:hypothetical protein
MGHLVGPLLQPILGGLPGGTGGLNPVHLVGPILQPILGGPSGGMGGLGLGEAAERPPYPQVYGTEMSVPRGAVWQTDLREGP